MRWLIRIVLTLSTLAVVLTAGLFLLPADRITALAARQFAAATGRQLEITGPVAPSIWPVLGLKTGPVTLANADWSQAGPMLRAEALSIGLDPRALIRGDLEIRQVEFIAPEVLIELHADGRVNWLFAQAAAAGVDGEARGAASGRRVTLDHAIIRDGTIRFLDHRTGAQHRLSAVDLDLKLPDLAGELDIALAGQLNGQPLSLAVRLDGAATAFAGGVVPVTAEVVLAGARGQFDGRAGAARSAEGRIVIEAESLDGAFAALALGPSGLPPGRLSVTATATYLQDGRLFLRDLAAGLGTNRVTGAADLTLSGARPRLTADLVAGPLTLVGGAQRAAGGVSAGGGGGGSSGWSTAPIDASAVGILDAEVALSAPSIEAGTLRLGQTRLMLRIDNARAVLDLREVQAYGGRVTGDLVVNNRSGLSVGGRLTATDLSAQPLLRDLADYERLIAPLDGQIEFLGVGSSMAAVMSSLSGQGRVALGQGQLQGLDIVGMLRRMDASFVGEGARTIFDSVAGSFTIQNGILRNEDLALVAPFLRASGRGSVDLGSQTLDYRITPTALQAEDGTGGVRVPLSITGAWDNPRLRLDVDSLAGDRLREERDRLEAEARARAEAAAAERLGAAEGESLEDAARRRLEREALRGLQKLIGGN